MAIICFILAAILAAANLLGYAAISWWVVAGIGLFPAVFFILLLVVFGTFTASITRSSH